MSEYSSSQIVGRLTFFCYMSVLSNNSLCIIEILNQFRLLRSSQVSSTVLETDKTFSTLVVRSLYGRTTKVLNVMAHLYWPKVSLKAALTDRQNYYEPFLKISKDMNVIDAIGEAYFT